MQWTPVDEFVKRDLLKLDPTQRVINLQKKTATGSQLKEHVLLYGSTTHFYWGGPLLLFFIFIVVTASVAVVLLLLFLLSHNY